MGPDMMVSLANDTAGPAAREWLSAQKINDDPVSPQGAKRSHSMDGRGRGNFSNPCEECLQFYIEFVTITEQIDST